MNKVTSYLKTFFMLDSYPKYSVRDFKDYTGPGFTRYKKSSSFNGSGGVRGIYPQLDKAEVAAYSEMTKVALLIAMAVVATIFVAWDILVIQTLLSGSLDFILGATLVGTMLLGTLFVVALYPRIVFLLKNFKVSL
jgi:hypothetical protein